MYISEQSLLSNSSQDERSYGIITRWDLMRSRYTYTTLLKIYYNIIIGTTVQHPYKCKVVELFVEKIIFQNFFRTFSPLLFRNVLLRSSPPEVFLGKDILKIFSKVTGENPCWSVILIKLQSNFIEIAHHHGCSTVNLLYILRTPFPQNKSGGLLLSC